MEEKEHTDARKAKESGGNHDKCVGKKQWNDKLGGYAKHGNSNGGRTM